jgi:hypothetical protein
VRKDATFTELTETQLNFVLTNLREHDEVELNIFGITAENAWGHMQNMDENICVEIDGEPICVFGYVLTATTIRFNFFGTHKVDTNWKQITKSADSYITYYMRKFPLRRGVIEVWEGHVNSRRWLRLLNFIETCAYRSTKYGRTIFVEYNKYNKIGRTKECVHLQPSL